MGAFWSDLPTLFQDVAVFLALLVPLIVLGVLVTRGYRPWPLVRAMGGRFRGPNLVFLLLVALSGGVGAGVIAMERGLREGTARAASKFDLIVAAPGDETAMMLATVYLQPTDAPLLSGATYAEIAGAEAVALAAPLAYGDSWQGHPIVGTIADFVDHLSDGGVAGGFADHFDAVVGADVPLDPGDTFTPVHGLPDEAARGDAEVHAGTIFTVTARMAPTGSPWDGAILVPVEAVWRTHGLADGHAPANEGRIGPPFDPDYFPGTPAILVSAEELWANYALRAEFTTEETMAFFPGAVLARLHGLLGDVREVMSLLSLVTQALVGAAILMGLFILTRLFARQIAVLRALGAPRRFVFAIVWVYATGLIGVGIVLGLAVGYFAAGLFARIATERTDILILARLGWPELHLAAAVLSVTAILALVPASLAAARPVVPALRS